MPHWSGFLFLIVFACFMYFSISHALKENKKKPKDLDDDEFEITMHTEADKYFKQKAIVIYARSC